MPVEIVGQQLRIRVRTPRGATRFATHDVGRRGRLQRIAGYYPRYGWKTQAWRINLRDYKNYEDVVSTINSLRIPSKYKTKAKHIAYRWFLRGS